MLINGTKVTGLFKFKQGLTYTLGDIIYHVEGDELYLVKDDYYTATVDPNKSDSCIEYFSDRFVTADKAKSLINKVFNGIGLNGEITELGSSVNLNDYMNTGAYTLVISSQLNLPIGITSGNTVLLRVYKSASDIIQEVIDYSVPAMYYRSYFNGVWSSWSPITNATSDAVTNLIATYKSTCDSVNTSLEYLDNVKKSARVLDEVPITASTSVEITPSNKSLVTDLLIGVSYIQDELNYFDYMYLHAESNSSSYSKMTNGGVLLIKNYDTKYTVSINSVPDGVTNAKISKAYLVNSLNNG